MKRIEHSNLGVSHNIVDFAGVGEQRGVGRLHLAIEALSAHPRGSEWCPARPALGLRPDSRHYLCMILRTATFQTFSHQCHSFDATARLRH